MVETDLATEASPCEPTSELKQRTIISNGNGTTPKKETNGYVQTVSFIY